MHIFIFQRSHGFRIHICHVIRMPNGPEDDRLSSHLGLRLRIACGHVFQTFRVVNSLACTVLAMVKVAFVDVRVRPTMTAPKASRRRHKGNSGSRYMANICLMMSAARIVSCCHNRILQLCRYKGDCHTTRIQCGSYFFGDTRDWTA